MIRELHADPASELQKLADEYGELDRQVAAFAPIKKRHELVSARIRILHSDLPADQPATIEGEDYRVNVGACGLERFFSLKAKTRIWKVLGKAAAMQAFSITQTAVKNALGEAQMEELLTTEQSGSRTLKAVLTRSAKAA